MGANDDIIDAFRTLTTDGGDKISADDLIRLLTTMGEKWSEKEAEELVEAAGGASKIDYAQFVKKMEAKAFDDGKDAE
jgi:Ca2+-binding EF-hand superfamily protein